MCARGRATVLLARHRFVNLRVKTPVIQSRGTQARQDVHDKSRMSCIRERNAQRHADMEERVVLATLLVLIMIKGGGEKKPKKSFSPVTPGVNRKGHTMFCLLVGALIGFGRLVVLKGDTVVKYFNSSAMTSTFGIPERVFNGLFR